MTRRYVQTVTLKNNSADTLSGPISLAARSAGRAAAAISPPASHVIFLENFVDNVRRKVPVGR